MYCINEDEGGLEEFDIDGMDVDLEGREDAGFDQIAGVEVSGLLAEGAEVSSGTDLKVEGSDQDMMMVVVDKTDWDGTLLEPGRVHQVVGDKMGDREDSLGSSQMVADMGAS